MPLPTKMWDGVAWCPSRNCLKDHPGLNPTHTMCSLVVTNYRRTRYIFRVGSDLLDIKEKETSSSKPSSTVRLHQLLPVPRPYSVAIYDSITDHHKRSFFPIADRGIVSTNNGFSAEVLLQVVSKTPSVSWSYAMSSQLCG